MKLQPTFIAFRYKGLFKSIALDESIVNYCVRITWFGDFHIYNSTQIQDVVIDIQFSGLLLGSVALIKSEK